MVLIKSFNLFSSFALKFNSFISGIFSDISGKFFISYTVIGCSSFISTFNKSLSIANKCGTNNIFWFCIASITGNNCSYTWTLFFNSKGTWGISISTIATSHKCNHFFIKSFISVKFIFMTFSFSHSRVLSWNSFTLFHKFIFSSCS